MQAVETSRSVTMFFMSVIKESGALPKTPRSELIQKSLFPKLAPKLLIQSPLRNLLSHRGLIYSYTLQILLDKQKTNRLS